MTERLVRLVLNEGGWLTLAMLLSGVAVLALAGRQRGRPWPGGFPTLRAMNLFYGTMIGVMAGGHLLAVSVKLARGTLEGAAWPLYLLGLGLGVPAGWLVIRAGRSPRGELVSGRRTVVLNLWLAASLLALGVHNWPLAAPALLNVAYEFHTRRAVGWAIGAVAMVIYLGLLVGSLFFLTSGQSFEQFSGLE